MIVSTNFFIGIDVSKPYFDVSLMVVVNYVKQGIEAARLTTRHQVKLFEKWLKSPQNPLQ